jgi:hypothetical protein
MQGCISSKYARSGPDPLMQMWANDLSKSTGLAKIASSSSPSSTNLSVDPVGNGASISCLCATSPPRNADKIHVHINDVPATHGILAHMGMKAKLINVLGTQTFHKAAKSSFIFSLYVVILCFRSGLSLMTNSLVLGKEM